MNTQKIVTNIMQNDKEQKITIKTYPVLTIKTKQIYEALNFKYIPFGKLKSVLPKI